MGIDIGTGESPDADVGGVRDPTNPDTYEPDDDNGNTNQIQSDAPGIVQRD